MKKVLLIAVIVFNLISTTLVADENSLKKDKIGMDFSIPNSTSTWIGGRVHIDNSLALQVNASLGYQFEDEDHNQLSGGNMGLGFYFNKYLRDRRVAPYIKGGLLFLKNFGDAHEGDDEIKVALGGGLGVSFFATKEFAISGEALLNLAVSPTVIFSTVTPQLFATFYF